MPVVNRLDKVVGRYKELVGKDFTKITEQKLNLQTIIAELEDSVNDIKKDKSVDKLQVQRLQAMLIKQKQNLNLLNRKLL